MTGEVRLDLFNGPGFSVDKVVVHEDPAVGLEPFAYVESIEARVSFASFWTGRLEFANLRLLNASINLARPEGGHWNFESMLTRTAGAVADASVHLPEIQLRGSRINFRYGEIKSAFYLADARLDASPPSSSGGEWRARFEGEPARTDRSSRGFGQFTARGRWRPGDGIDATVDLEKGSLSDLIRFAHGHDIGVHGHISSHTRLVGPLSNVRITGRMQIGDFHRWDLLPPYTGGWPLDYRGTLDVIGQTLRIETAGAGGVALPVAVEFRASGILSQPRWAALVKLDRMPLAPLEDVARHMGLALPETLAASGDLSGVIGYAPETGIQGMLSSGEALVTISDAPQLRFENAQVLLDRDTVRLLPAAFQAGQESANIQGEYAWHAQIWSARISADDTPLAEPGPGGVRLLGAVPFLEQCSKGNWSGDLDYRKEGEQPGRWTGVFRLAGAAISLEGLADPLEIAAARVTVGENGFVVDRLHGSAGAVEFSGEYRYAPGTASPHQIQLRIPKLAAEELERLLMPSLRRDENLISRALRLGRATLPEWLEQRRLEADVHIGELVVDQLPLENLQARVHWDGASIEAAEVAAKFGEGSLTGRLSANLGRSAPAYRMALRFRGVGWMGGTWNGRTALETSGTGEDLMRNLRLNGSFKARSVSIAAGTEAQDLSGTYVFAMQGRSPTFHFSDMVMTLGDVAFKGQGATGADGRVHLDLSDGQTQMRLNATLSPFALELTAERGPGSL